VRIDGATVYDLTGTPELSGPRTILPLITDSQSPSS
jgi:hypothetical protein